LAYDEQTLNEIYDRTDGRCHICGKKLSRINYSLIEGRAAWEVEHSRPRAKGGMDHLNNLYAACIRCNREKGTVTTQTARAWHGRTRAPLSKEKRREIKQSNTVLGTLVGAVVGILLAPESLLLCAAVAFLGGKVGYDKNPE